MANTVELEVIIAALNNDSSRLEALIVSSAINWHEFFQIIIRHRIWHQAHRAFAKLKCKSKVPIYAKLAKFCQQDKLRIFSLVAETCLLARTFAAQQIPYCFIKGPILNVSLYEELTIRPCRDLDVWIEYRALQQATKALLALGYQKKKPVYELIGFKEEYYLKHKHDITFYHRERNMLVELHFRLNYLGINFVPLSPAICKKIILWQTPIQTLNDDYHLLFLMIHGAIHGWIRLRWLYDLHLYIKSGKCSLTNLMILAEKIHCKHIVYQALTLLNDFFPVANAELLKILTNLKQPQQSPPFGMGYIALLLIRSISVAHAHTALPRQKYTCKRYIKLAALAKQFIIADYQPEKNPGIFTKHFFYYRFYLVKLATSGEKMHAFVGDLFKIDKLFPFLSLPNKLKFCYYLLYPLWVISYIFLGK